MLPEEEINAYLAPGKVKLPAESSPSCSKTSREWLRQLCVDFDKLKHERISGNPWLSIFAGTHEVLGRAHAHGSHGKGFVDVDSVSLDQVEIPRFMLRG